MKKHAFSTGFLCFAPFVAALFIFATSSCSLSRAVIVVYAPLTSVAQLKLPAFLFFFLPFSHRETVKHKSRVCVCVCVCLYFTFALQQEASVSFYLPTQKSTHTALPPPSKEKKKKKKKAVNKHS